MSEITTPPVLAPLPSSQNSPEIATATRQNAAEIIVKTKHLLNTTLIIFAVLMIINIGLILFTQKNVKDLKTTKQVVASMRAQSADTGNIQEYLLTKKDVAPKIIRVFPDENRLVDFVATMELIAKAHSSASNLEFISSAPINGTSGKYIPFLLKLTTDLDNLKELFIKIEKIPYIVEVGNFQLSKNTDTLYDALITAKVYVQDPFIYNTNSQMKLGTNP